MAEHQQAILCSRRWTLGVEDAGPIERGSLVSPSRVRARRLLHGEKILGTEASGQPLPPGRHPPAGFSPCPRREVHPSPHPGRLRQVWFPQRFSRSVPYSFRRTVRPPPPELNRRYHGLVKARRARGRYGSKVEAGGDARLGGPEGADQRAVINAVVVALHLRGPFAVSPDPGGHGLRRDPLREDERGNIDARLLIHGQAADEGPASRRPQGRLRVTTRPTPPSSRSGRRHLDRRNLLPAVGPMRGPRPDLAKAKAEAVEITGDPPRRCGGPLGRVSRRPAGRRRAAGRAPIPSRRPVGVGPHSSQCQQPLPIPGTNRARCPQRRVCSLNPGRSD